MKINVQKSKERGITKLDWLLSKHSFSFNTYYNPKRMNFGKLIVLNDDIVNPNSGFGMHNHENMEIISIVLEGSLKHNDDQGNSGLIHSNEVQIMSAGTGITHSEYNPSKKDKVHFLQIWIEPKKLDIRPSYKQKLIPDTKDKFILIVDKKVINQNAFLYLGNFKDKKNLNYKLNNSKNGVFILIIKGKIKIENKILEDGDSAEITDVNNIGIEILQESKVLLIEVPNR